MDVTAEINQANNIPRPCITTPKATRRTPRRTPNHRTRRLPTSTRRIPKERGPMGYVNPLPSSPLLLTLPKPFYIQKDDKKKQKQKQKPEAQHPQTVHLIQASHPPRKQTTRVAERNTIHPLSEPAPAPQGRARAGRGRNSSRRRGGIG